MEYVRIRAEHFEELVYLQQSYKEEIGEAAPTAKELESLKKAIATEQIHFYGCICNNALIACCSVCYVYSTFQYDLAGVFEDFYIQPTYRHQGIARKLVSFAWEQSGVGAMTVGCADCDVAMYQSIGFKLRLGNMLAFSK